MTEADGLGSGKIADLGVSPLGDVIDERDGPVLLRQKIAVGSEHTALLVFCRREGSFPEQRRNHIESGLPPEKWSSLK